MLTKEERNEMLLTLKKEEESVADAFSLTFKEAMENLENIMNELEPPEGGMVPAAYAKMKTIFININAYKYEVDNLKSSFGTKIDASPI